MQLRQNAPDFNIQLHLVCFRITKHYHYKTKNPIFLSDFYSDNKVLKSCVLNAYRNRVVVSKSKIQSLKAIYNRRAEGVPGPRGQRVRPAVHAYADCGVREQLSPGEGAAGVSIKRP